MQFARGIIYVGTLDTTYNAFVAVFVGKVLHAHLCFVMETKQGSWKNNQYETNGPVFPFILKQAKPLTCLLSIQQMTGV